MLTRRHFLEMTAAATASLSLAVHHVRATQVTNRASWPIAIFEKVFEALSYEELADAVVQIDADGVEATIRPGGHIEPEAAAVEVPKMAAAMRQRGKRIVIAATSIGSVDEPHTKRPASNAPLHPHGTHGLPGLRETGDSGGHYGTPKGPCHPAAMDGTLVLGT